MVYYVHPKSIRATTRHVSQFLSEKYGWKQTANIKNANHVFVDIEFYNEILPLRKNYSFNINRLPKVSALLDNKEMYYQNSKQIPKTFLHVADTELTGVWVQKYLYADKGLGIQFIKNPGKWEKYNFALQKRVDPNQSLLQHTNGKIFDVRILVLIKDDGSCKIYRDGLIRCAQAVWTGETDLMSNNANIAFQQTMGYKNCERFLLSNFKNYKLYIEQMCEIIEQDILFLRSGNVFGQTTDFEIFGYDFMIDNNDIVYCIEVNDNPGFFRWSPMDDHFFKNALEYLFLKN